MRRADDDGGRTCLRIQGIGATPAAVVVNLEELRLPSVNGAGVLLARTLARCIRDDGFFTERQLQ